MVGTAADRPGASARRRARRGAPALVDRFALIFLAIIHLVLNHVTTDVACTSYQLVALRYENPFWRLYDWLLLTLALLHGMNGLRVVIDDYVRTRSWRLALQSTIGVLTLIFFMLGTITLITFQPVPGTVAGPHCL